MEPSSHISYTAPLLSKLESGTLKVCSVGAGYVGSLVSLTLATLNPKQTFEVCDINAELIGKWNAG